MIFEPYSPSSSVMDLSGLTFNEIFNRVFLPDRPTISDAYIGYIRNCIQKWVLLMDDCPADKIGPDELRQFRDKCLTKRLCGSTINGTIEQLVKLMRAVNLSIDYSEIKLPWRSPAEKLTLSELTELWSIAGQAKWPAATCKDYRALPSDRIPGFWWRALFMLAYSTGMRRGDLFRLRWDQVEQVCIRVSFGNGARPKLLPITEPLRPWLQLLSQNETETVLGHSDGNSFDGEMIRLRELVGLQKLGMQSLRYLSVNEWERAGKGCGSLILNHKQGERISDHNYRKLAIASSALAYPTELLSATAELDQPRRFLDPQLSPLDSIARIAERLAPKAAQTDSSLATFRNFFSPDESSAPTRLESMTLRDVFETSLRPILETDGRTVSTMRGYRLALTHWERLTSNPLIKEITNAYLQEFRKSAKDELYRSPASYNSWFRSLRSILNHLGPRSNLNARTRAALAFYTEVPWLDDLKQDTPNPVHLDDDQINRLYFHSQIAEWPAKSRTGCEPCDWWRCAIVMMVNYGQRRSDWYNMRTNAVSFEKGTVIFKAEKTGKRQILVLNPTVAWHLRKLSPDGREFIFSPSQTSKQLYREWHRIQSAAKVADPDGMPFTFHSLRATAAMRYHEYFPGTAELLLGHALRRESQVTAKHYLGNAQLKPLWNAIRNIPQPSAFLDAMQADSVKRPE